MATDKDIKQFTKAVSERFDKLSKGQLFRTNIDKYALWDKYLASFPEGTNPMFKTRTEHDCNCCKNFIRDVGNVVAIENGQIQTIWDVEVPGFYGEVAKAMAEYVRTGLIVDRFSHREKKAGTETSRQQIEGGGIRSWNHLFAIVPNNYINVSPDTLNEARNTVAVFERGIKEITNEAVDTVLELIGQRSLYKGDEFKTTVEGFKKLKAQCMKLKTDQEKNIFLWSNAHILGARIKNTVIGTLLEDLSLDEDLDKAVRSFESKVAPTNYKRPTAIVTKTMIEQAMKTIEALGIEPALYRRFAVPEDISVNNVLFANRGISSIMKDGLKSTLMETVKDVGDYSRVEKVPVEKFIKDILPNITEMEVKVENKHTNNFMSLIAPKNEAHKIFKWNNNFSWSYNGNVTDSIKERVKAAGGDVTGILRVSLSWFNGDDLDLHIVEPKGNRICYSSKINPKTTGKLDVDMNAGGPQSRTPVENITWTARERMEQGVYKVIVNQFNKRESADIGFVIQTECNGVINNYSYQKAVANRANVNVMTFKWDGTDMKDIKIGDDISGESISKEVWGLTTEKFHKVNILTISPNYWDGQEIGNKHYFFILDKCVNDQPPRGIYNEFLSSELEKHRKVLEMIGEKTKCEPTDKQLSGLGFSSTQRNTLLCKVKGNFNRTLYLEF